jgi:hypothetical protein
MMLSLSLLVMIQGHGGKVYRLAVPMLQCPDINTTTLPKNATQQTRRGEEKRKSDSGVTHDCDFPPFANPVAIHTL